MKLEERNGLPSAEDGSAVTTNMVSGWDEAYSTGNLPRSYEYDGPAKSGRPKMFDGEMSTLTIRLPLAQKKALAEEASKHGMSISSYARELLTVR